MRSGSGLSPPDRAKWSETAAPSTSPKAASNALSATAERAPSSIANARIAATVADTRADPSMLAVCSNLAARWRVLERRLRVAGLEFCLIRSASSADQYAAATSDVTGIGSLLGDPISSKTSWPWRSPSPRVQRSWAGWSCPSYGTNQVVSDAATLSCTMRLPARSVDGQWIPSPGSPSRQARMPSISPAWLPRSLVAEPSRRDARLSIGSTGPHAGGATWIGWIGIVMVRRHQIRPAGPGDSTRAVSCLMIPACSKRAFVPIRSVGLRPSSARILSESARSTSATAVSKRSVVEN